jgi:oxygen-independent coproporphyrinogen-3 oxidase
MNYDITIGGQTVHLTEELLRRYDVPGPRYTSYPTAPQWNDDFGPTDWDCILTSSNTAPEGDRARPLSLYMHLPFCERMCLFCGCNIIVRRNHDWAEPYLATLKRDIAQLARRLDTAHRPVVQFHWGGGTPTYFTPEQLEDLFEFTREHFAFADDAELGVEIDPRVTTSEHLTTLRRLGFNRLSMGVQDFNPAVQEAVKRVQPFASVKAMVDQCRDLDFESMNIDLIYGLPLQTADSFADTIDQVVSLDPDRIAVFNYGHVPWVKKQQRALTEMLPAPSEKFQIFKTAIGKLTGAGYEYIGMDNFARPDDELCVAQKDGTLHRNFQGYTTKAGADLVGFGVTSISEMARSYAQNFRPLDQWRQAVEADTLPVMRGVELTDDDVVRRAAIQAIMCATVLDKPAFAAKYGIDVDTYFADAEAKLQPLVDDGLVEITDTRIRATGVGRVFLRNIAMAFDAYLKTDPDKPMYSRTL